MENLTSPPDSVTAEGMLSTMDEPDEVERVRQRVRQAAIGAPPEPWSSLPILKIEGITEVGFAEDSELLTNMLRLREALRGDIYGVLGNHDTVLMLPDLERMGIRMLMNEHLTIERGGSEIFLAGIDDAHFYRMDNIEKVAAAMPRDTFSILLSHTPEIYRQASHAGFDFLLAGHTHGGQICLPGGIPVFLSSKMPRSLGKGAWKYRGMAGYTSVGAGACGVPVRFNCPPEVTLHTLRKAR